MAPMCVATNDPKMLYYRGGYSRSGDHWKLLGGPSIGDGVRIAVGVILFPNIHIGKHSVIGAGALVTKDVPDNSIVFGVPAERRGQVREDEDKIIECKADHS